MERISDIRHASDVSRTSPGNAKSILEKVISQLTRQHDDEEEYVKPLKRASEILLDSPRKARDLIMLVCEAMEADKEEKLRDDAEPWQHKNQE
jgi:hypothetical protein